MTRPRLLDLFCGAGGAAMGYHRAGFDVVGVDHKPQPRYPFEFVEHDALDYLHHAWGLDEFDAIHASPPCQAHTAMGAMWNARRHLDLIADTRRLLRRHPLLPYVIENVEGAPLEDPVTICGSSAGAVDDVYELRRHRLFETNWPLLVPPCAHGRRPVLGVYGDHGRDRRRIGHPDRGTDLPAGEALERARTVMEMPWANWRELSQAIPPAYTELIGHQLMQHLRVAA